jgi:hypothetical protein
VTLSRGDKEAVKRQLILCEIYTDVWFMPKSVPIVHEEHVPAVQHRIGHTYYLFSISVTKLIYTRPALLRCATLAFDEYRQYHTLRGLSSQTRRAVHSVLLTE